MNSQVKKIAYLTILITLYRCSFEQKAVVNIEINNHSGWCFIFFNESENSENINTSLDSNNFACVSKYYFDSKAIFKIINSNGELLNDKIKFLSHSSRNINDRYFSFYVPNTKEKKLSEDYWLPESGNNIRFFLERKKDSILNRIKKLNICPNE